MSRISRTKRDKLFQKLKDNDYRCPLCNAKIYFWKKNTYNIDHIIPKSKGGSNDVENLQYTHTKCNHLKANQDIEQGDFVAFHKMQHELNIKKKLENQDNNCSSTNN